MISAKDIAGYVLQNGVYYTIFKNGMKAVSTHAEIQAFHKTLQPTKPAPRLPVSPFQNIVK